MIEVPETASERVRTEKTHIIQIEETELGFWRRLNGQIGLSYKKGNQTGQ
jgi:hypothetical protein